jgi:GT2 family glycosyltransferase
MINANIPKVAICIVGAKNIDAVKTCLQSLSKITYKNWELIILSLSSSDIIRIVNYTIGQKGKIVEIKNDLGVSQMRNIAAKIASSGAKYLAFLDDDTYVSPAWLEPIIALMESNQKIGIAQSLLINGYNHDRIDGAGDFINCLGFVGIRGKNTRVQDNFRNMEEIFSARGAALVIRKNIFEDLGGFDPTFSYILMIWIFVGVQD